jgi:hypothetical protein
MKDDSVLNDLDKKMSVISGKTGVIQKIEEENGWRIEKTLRRFEIGDGIRAEEVYTMLLLHLKKGERQLHAFLGGEVGEEFHNFPALLKRGMELMKPKKLWVLKKEKFREIIEQSPPPNIMKKFGYKDGKELFDNERLEEIASSLRFMESNEWMHETFDKAYASLTPDDFEERNAEAILLSGKWLSEALKFVEKKHHNLSHLKELGLVFVIPIKLNKPGELMRVFTLYLHYLYEVQFYSDLFYGIKEGNGDFAKGVISLLRGDILDEAPQAPKGSFNWLIVQRYLAKEDEYEKRLFVPHVNPEAIHWRVAEKIIASIGEKDLAQTLETWVDLDWVGGYFENQLGKELISFDLIDMIMSLVDEKYVAKYLYHQQEALWNRIFEGYMGDGEKLESLIKQNLLRGFITCHES